MRVPPTMAASVGLLMLASCAVDPLTLEPPEHNAILEEAQSFSTSPAPAALPSGFDAARDGEPWRAGDRAAYGLRFEHGAEVVSYWLLVEVVEPATYGTSGSLDKKAVIRTTLLEESGAEIGWELRTVDPDLLDANGLDTYARVVEEARLGASAERLQELTAQEMAPDSEFDRTRTEWFREIRRALAPRFVRKQLKDAAMASTIGGVSFLDIGLSLFTPPEVLIDVKRLSEDVRSGSPPADAFPVTTTVRIPFAIAIGGASKCRISALLTGAGGPYALGGGFLELAGGNEQDESRRFAIRLIGARRGAEAAPSCPAVCPAAGSDPRAAPAACAKP